MVAREVSASRLLYRVSSSWSDMEEGVVACSSDASGSTSSSVKVIEKRRSTGAGLSPKHTTMTVHTTMVPVTAIRFGSSTTRLAPMLITALVLLGLLAFIAVELVPQHSHRQSITMKGDTLEAAIDMQERHKAAVVISRKLEVAPHLATPDQASQAHKSSSAMHSHKHVSTVLPNVAAHSTSTTGPSGDPDGTNSDAGSLMVLTEDPEQVDTGNEVTSTREIVDVGNDPDDHVTPDELGNSA